MVRQPAVLAFGIRRAEAAQVHARVALHRGAQALRVRGIRAVGGEEFQVAVLEHHADVGGSRRAGLRLLRRFRRHCEAERRQHARGGAELRHEVRDVIEDQSARRRDLRGCSAHASTPPSANITAVIDALMILLSCIKGCSASHLKKLLKTLRLSPLGDAAVYAEFGEGRAAASGGVDLELNRSLQALAAAIRVRAIPWIRDVVPALCGIALHFDPFHPELPDAVLEVCEALLKDCFKSAAKFEDSGRTVEVPVCYDPEFALDLMECVAHDGVRQSGNCTPRTSTWC